jgi:GAF domain-containing protein
MYSEMIAQAKSLCKGESNFIANAANISALIYEKMQDINWIGFYMKLGNELVLGPFQGKTACIRIPMGRGVCGTSALETKTIIVPDVHKFEGHIACDSASNSEIVVPLMKDDKFYGVLDCDSPVFERFSEQEEQLFSEICKILTEESDMLTLTKYYEIG